MYNEMKCAIYNFTPLVLLQPFAFLTKRKIRYALVVVTGRRKLHFVCLFFDPGGRPLPCLVVVGAGAGSFRGLPRPRRAGAGMCPSSSKVLESVNDGLSLSIDTHS